MRFTNVWVLLYLLTANKIYGKTVNTAPTDAYFNNDSLHSPPSNSK